MESEGKFLVVYSSEQERFVTPHGLYLGEKVPAVETPERTRVIIQKLLESGTPSLPLPLSSSSSRSQPSSHSRQAHCTPIELKSHFHTNF
jgi:hypothetical protein